MEPMPVGSGKSFLSDFVPIELARGNCFVNASKILKNNAARAQVQMADFGISHLAFGQTNIGATRAQLAARIVTIKLFVKWRFRQKRGVAILLAQFFTARVNAPTI